MIILKPTNVLNQGLSNSPTNRLQRRFGPFFATFSWVGLGLYVAKNWYKVPFSPVFLLIIVGWSWIMWRSPVSILLLYTWYVFLSN